MGIYNNIINMSDTRKEKKRIEKLLNKALTGTKSMKEDKSMSDKDKFESFCTKYEQELKRNSELINENIITSKKSINLTSDYEYHMKENDKLNRYKSKLEKIVKDLQSQNKKLVDDANALAEVEKNKREEIQAQFNKSIQDIQEKVKVQSEDHEKYREENISLRNKLMSIWKKFEAKEKLFEEKINKRETETKQHNKKMES